MLKSDAMIRIILAEDHNIVRNGIRNLLEKEKDLKVVGEALNGQEVLDMLNNGIKADIVLADINMPLMSGIEMSDKVSSVSEGPKTVILSMLDHERYVLEAFQAGASGYLLKNISADELVFAVRHIYISGRYICSELALRFLDRLLKQPGIPEPRNDNDVKFTTREIEVLMLIADGYTNHEIADKLFTSKRTIEGNRQTLLEKSGTRNTAALIRYALQRGIIN